MNKQTNNNISSLGVKGKRTVFIITTTYYIKCQVPAKTMRKANKYNVSPINRKKSKQKIPPVTGITTSK
jgi:hypothetical protein